MYILYNLFIYLFFLVGGGATNPPQQNIYNCQNGTQLCKTHGGRDTVNCTCTLLIARQIVLILRCDTYMKSQNM